ncbi:hypothetical protein [Okeania sp. SIO2B3]|uniref:TRAFAC clade GTPase domain-containing protein n=1 Tax=Okeania sp. SIO2B3 TaxID=2607784 RepID=UPI0013C05762|nr:hypothetical protein [Okeania sp. SIO2B3]NET41857.1 hypothetical protein [Okeania sp. SIO2B3]
MFNTKANETVNEPVNEPSPKPRPIPSQIRLGIWGFHHAGKSVYMLRLYEYLLNEGKIQITDWDTEEYINNGMELLDRGIFVSPTATAGKKSKYSYTINNEDGSNTELTFLDIAGDILRDPYHDFLDENSQENTVVDYLLQCHGIIFLLSPLQEDKQTKPYHTLLMKLFIAMQRKSGRKPLEQYVAFGITKIDHPEVNQKLLQEKYQYPEQMFLEMLGKGPNVKLQWLKGFFHAQIEKPKDKSKDNPRLNINPTRENRCQLFYISAFGTYKDSDGNVKSPVILDKEEKQKSTTSKAESEEDPIFSTYEQDDPDPYDFGKENIKTEDINPNKYKIDTEAPFNPINIFSPIEWLVRGIKSCPPNISNTSSSDSNT